MDLKAASFEMNDDPVTEDILSGLGFAYGLALTLRLFRKVAWPCSCSCVARQCKSCNFVPCMWCDGCEAGLNFEAPVCSTWVWVNRHRHQEHFERLLGFGVDVNNSSALQGDKWTEPSLSTGRHDPRTSPCCELRLQQVHA